MTFARLASLSILPFLASTLSTSTAFAGSRGDDATESDPHTTDDPPAASVDTPTKPSEPDKSAPSLPRKFEIEANGGPVYGVLIDIPSWGGRVSAGIAIPLRTNVAGVAEVFYARTTSEDGLQMQWGGASSSVFWTPWRLRIGGGFDLLYFDLARASHSGDPSLTHPGVGVHAHLGFDVIQFDEHHAIEMAAAPEADWLFGVPLYSTTLTLAARF
jgi:hypothetical protein